MAERKKLPELDLTGAKLSVVGSDVVAARRRTRGVKVRSKAQKTLDALVQKAYDKWVADGKPEDFAKRPGGNILIKESQLITVQRALHNAAGFLNMSVRFGDILVEDGYADVVFTATDRKPRTPKTVEA